MKTRTEAVCLLAGSGVADLSLRLAQVALPLVILAGTGSVAATGLVGGASGIPMLLSPWWARRARQWVDSGRRLAAVAVVEAFALALVPAAAAAGMLSVVVLALSGLVLGSAEALSAPGRAALIADVGDRLGPDRAVTLLTTQDALRRAGMIAGPPLAALAVAAGHTLSLLWLEAAVVLLTGALAWPVTGAVPGMAEEVRAPSIRAVLAGRSEVLLGWVLRGTGCVIWFAFTLGLSVIGVDRGRPGVYLAYGMTGYGIGALAGTGLAVHVVRRVPALRLACVAWTVAGLCWIAMGLWNTPLALAFIAATDAVAVVVGIAAITALITRSSSGAERRTLLSGQTVVVNAGAAAGMLLGGPLIAAIGPESTLVLTGLIATAVSVTVAAAVVRPQQRAVISVRHDERVVS